MEPVFGGVWPAMVTPLTEEGKPTFAVLEQLTDLFVRQGLGGIYLTGSTGQWPLLTVEERRQIAARVVRTAAGRIPVMVHVGAVTTADAVALGRHAAEIGADAVSSVAPIYYSHSPAAVFHHYHQVGAAGGLPFYVYHFSPVHQLALAPREYADRILALPNIAGMKITDHDLYSFGLIQAHTAGRLRLFSGADELLCHAVLSGAIGAIGTFYNLWGPACSRARQTFAGGAVEPGREFMLRFQSAIGRVLSAGGVWSFLRSAMRRKYQLDIGMPRPPLGAVDQPWTAAEVQELLDLVEGDKASPGSNAGERE